MSIHETGFTLYEPGMATEVRSDLRDQIFVEGRAGVRCLLDHPLVRSVAIELRHALVAAGHLQPAAVAIQAIAFDKSPGANWKVIWHQDVMFPFASPVSHPGFDFPSTKDGIDYARPPQAVLEDLLAVRLHLDDCDESNGPLRVAPGSHVHGVLRSAGIAGYVERHGQTVCLAREGEALLMKPLLLHASSPAINPRHRRVLHLVYYSGAPMPQRWHRAL